MSCSVGAVRFPDGKILYWCYNYSADLALPSLFETVEDANPESSDYATCDCGKHESVEFFLDGALWQGRACQHCRHIQDDHLEDNPELLESDSDVAPDWLVWDANIIPTEGGEKEATLAYWERLVDVIGVKSHLRPDRPNLDGLLRIGGADTFFSLSYDTKKIASTFRVLGETIGTAAEHIAKIPLGNVTPDLVSTGQRWAKHCRTMSEFYAECHAAVLTVLKKDPVWIRRKVVVPGLVLAQWLLLPLYIIPRLGFRMRYLNFSMWCIKKVTCQSSRLMDPLRARMTQLEETGMGLYKESRRLRDRLAKQHGVVFPDLDIH